MRHVAHVGRFLLQPAHNVAVVGIPGSGRQTAAMLAAGLAGMRVCTCSTHVDDSASRLQEALKEAYSLAGMEGEHVAVIVNIDGCLDEVSSLEATNGLSP